MQIPSPERVLARFWWTVVRTTGVYDGDPKPFINEPNRLCLPHQWQDAGAEIAGPQPANRDER